MELKVKINLHFGITLNLQMKCMCCFMNEKHWTNVRLQETNNIVIYLMDTDHKIYF